ncbi:MAG: class II aldolase/adducin family protein [Xanthomonadales bacterium]|nr:class II aldolase/adducin family protein [Xanthomonadales bacterium]
MSQAQELLVAARALARSGNVGTAGNLSLRLPDGLLITPSGVPYEQLQAEQMVQLDQHGRPMSPGRPSSEWRIHQAIYGQRPEVGAIVHAHPPNATALACLGLAIPAFHYEVAFAGGVDIRCADYATFGTEQLSAHVCAALDQRKACLMGNHGLVALGADLPAALALAERVEQLALIYRLCLSVGEPKQLSAEEMARVLDKFSDYGQP